MSQFEIVYSKYRSADDDAGDLAWAAKQGKRAMWVSEDEMTQENLRRLELTVDEKALVRLLRIPRHYAEAENCGALTVKESRRFMRALHAAEILEFKDVDKARALVPIELKRAREHVTGKASAPRKAPARLQAQVYRPSLDDEETRDEPAIRSAAPRSATPAVTPAASGPVSDEDRALEREIQDTHRRLRRANHFDVLGLERKPTTDEVKKAFFDLAKRFHPDRLAGHNFTDPARTTERMEAIFSRISEAYKVLLDEDGRRDYLQRLNSGTLDEATDAKGGKVRRPGEAQVQYRKGLVFLQKKDIPQARHMFQMAVDLDHGDPVYPSYLAWAGYLDETQPMEKREQEARDSLTQILTATPNVHAAYFLGMLLKIAGDDKTAYSKFKKAHELDPAHADAAREVRLYELRQTKSKRDTASANKFDASLGGKASNLLNKWLKK
ncbi:MAG: DnaJ domain-containing protein [Pseudomonadota bacterium]